MASVNFQKIHLAVEMRKMLRHCDKDKRLEDEHRNKHINKDMTYLNQQQFGYEEACKRYDDRIAELDRKPKANKRCDRVTAFGLDVPVPSGFDSLTPEQKDAWYQMALDECVIFAGGADNLVGWYIHEDEKHDYKHYRTGEQKTSREHIHVYVIPEHDGSLNGKWFSSSRRMKEIDRRIHQRSAKEFGLKFMDGSRNKSKEEVEELKRLSELQEQVQALSKERDDLQDDIDSIRQEAYQEAADIILEAREDARQRADEITQEAKQMADDQILEMARQIQKKRQAERGHEQFFKDMQQDYGNMDFQLQN